MISFSSPELARAARMGRQALILACEHIRWLGELSKAHVPDVIENMLNGKGGVTPQWGELLAACVVEGARQLAEFAIHSPTDAMLCVTALAQTVALLRQIRRRLRRKRARSKAVNAPLISTK
jgi:hypothetical protein